MSQLNSEKLEYLQIRFQQQPEMDFDIWKFLLVLKEVVPVKLADSSTSDAVKQMHDYALFQGLHKLFF
jgi:hypothetical protein